MKDVVKKAVISVSRLLGGGEEKSTGSVPRKIPLDFQGSSDGAAGDEAERARLSDVVTSLKTIEEQLGRLIKRGVPPAVGKMQVLRFEDLFQQIGDAAAEQVLDIMDAAIARHLSAEDVVRGFGNGVFVLVFADANRGQAEGVCAAIQRDLGAAFSQLPDLADAVEVFTAVAIVDGEVELTHPENLEALFRDAAPLPKLDDGADQGENSPGDDDELNWSKLSEFAGPADPDWRAIAEQGKWTMPDEWQLDAVDVETLRQRLNGLVFLDRPVWNVDRKVLELLGATPVAVRGADAFVESAMTRDDPTGAIAAALDRAALEWTLARVGELAPHHPGLVRVTAVCFKTLSVFRHRQALIDTLNRFDAKWRQHLWIEIRGLSKDHGTIAMEDAVRALGPFVDGIIADVGLAQTRPENLASLGVRWIGFAWAGEDLEDPAVMDAITRFAEKAARDGLAAYAKDLPNRNFVLAAGSLGINHVFAKPHMKPITDPGSLVFRIENLVTAGA